MRKNNNSIYRFVLMMTTVMFAMLSSPASAWADSPPETCSVGIFGTGDGEFQNPYGLAVDEARGCVYICDTGNDKIRKLSMFGEYKNSFGEPGSADGQFLHPQGAGVDSTNGNVYVADTVNQRIQKFDANSTFLLKFGSFGNQNGQFNLPRDIAVDSSGNVYICDSGNDRISKFTSSGTFSANIGQSSLLKNPYGIDVDSAGNIYIADTENHRIVKFAPDGTKTMEFGSYGTQSGQFRFPHDVVVGKNGNIYVADTDNYRIQKFDAQGTYINSFGVFVDFLSPQKLAIDSNGNLYVIDSNTSKMKIYNVSIYIGNLSVAPTPFSPDGDGFQDSTFINYTIPEPTNVTINIYDEQGNLIRNLIDGASRLTADNKEEWEGKDNTGAFVNAGTYTFKIDAVNAVNYHAPQRSCEAFVYYSKGEISGVVTDWNNPLANVAVSDGTRVTLTGPDGAYTIKNVPIGTYIVTANKNDYVGKSQQVAIITEGQKVTGVDFVLDPSVLTKGKISGKVTYGGIPLQGVNVSDGTRSVQTDTNGNYIIADIPAGIYTLTARKNGYRVSYKTVTVGSGGILINIDFTLEESDKPDMRVTPATLQFEVKSGQGISSMSLAQALQSGLSASISSQTIKSSSSSNALRGNVIPGEYIIKFKEGVSRTAQQDALAGIGAVSVKENRVHTAHLIRHSKITSKALVAAKNKPAELKQMEVDLTGFGSAMTNLAVSKPGLIEYVEPNREVHVLGSGTSTPNDTYFANQWGPQKIAAPDAWSIEAGEKNIIVAVVDSGVDYTHNDLSANYLPGGYDFVDDDNDPYPAADSIDNNQNGWVDEGVNHGTHVAGIIAAVANNSIGIAGIAKVSILSERVMNSDGDGTSFDVVEGINHAVANGAKIINLSLGGGGTSLERDACQNAWDNGCIIVGAAGNDYGGFVTYPAAYPTVIAVSATDSNDNLASFSSVGPEVELSAPGVSILSTIKDNQYEAESGTSMAAPHVAGVAALVWSANPGLTNEEVRKMLQDSADDLGTSGRDDNFGYGRVNAYKAVLNSVGLCQSQTITIYNDGGVNLDVTNVTNTYSWISVDKTSFTINPGYSTAVNVKIVSTGVSPGIYNDTIKIYSNDLDKNPYLIPIEIIVGAKPGEVSWQKENAAMVDGKYMPGAYNGGMIDSKPKFVDIDNDGDYDMFIGKYDGTISFYRNDGTAASPIWRFVTGSYLPTNTKYYSSPTFVDIDRDGDYDMFIGSSDGTMSFYRNDGTAASAGWTFVTAGYNSIDVGYDSVPTFVDIDNDGDYDMFIGNGDGTISFYRNTGMPTSASWALVTKNYNSIDVWESAPTFVDIDHDGDYDMFVGNHDGTISFYRNTGTPASASWTLVTSNYNSIKVGYLSVPTFVDIDHDGDYDMFIGKSDGTISFYRNDGAAASANWTLVIGSYISISIGADSAPVFVDINNDGDYDMFIGKYDGTISFYRNDGTATSPNWTLVTENYNLINVGSYSVPTFVDIDHDDDYDMFVGKGSGTISFYRNDGTAASPIWTFITTNYNSINGGYNVVPIFVDIDHDGDYDMFVGKGSGTISFYRNDGTAESPIWTLVTGNYDSIGESWPAPVFVDIDHDGDYDMFLGKYDGTISFYRNDGTAASPIWTFVTGSYNSIDIGGWSKPTFVDIDNDGDKDLFIGDESGGVSFYRNMAIAGNTPPIISLPNASLDKNTAIDLWNYSYDAETPNNLLAYSIIANTRPECAITIRSNRFIDIYPQSGWYGSSDVTVRVTDLGGAYTDDTFHVTVTHANNPPIITPSVPNPTAVDEDTPITVKLTSYKTDVEDSGVNLKWSVLGVQHCTVSGQNSADDVLIFTPEPNYYGQITATLVLTDSEGATTAQNIILTWNPVNDAPIVGNIPDVNFDEGGFSSSIDLDDYAADVDNPDSELSWIYSGNTNVNVSIDPGTHVVTFSSQPGWHGQEAIVLIARDPGGLSNSYTVSVIVAARYGSVSGIVTDEISSLPVAGILIKAYNWGTNELVDSAQTLSDGTYRFGSLPPEDYRIYADTEGADYGYEYYNNVEDQGSATKITVVLSATTQGVNFTLPVLEELHITIHNAFNQVCFAVMPQGLPSPYKASRLIQDMALCGVSIDIIMQWDEGIWVSHQVDLPFTDFDLKLDQGIFVSTVSETWYAGTWTIRGKKIKLPKTIDLREGWNLVNIPTTSNTANAIQALQEINSQGGTSDVIMWWDGDWWISSQIDLPFTDQELVKGGRSYFIRCYSNSRWEMR